MKIVDIMSADLIVPDLVSTTRDAVLGELVARIASVVGTVDHDAALHVLLDRERLGSTGVGHGIAIPHATLPNLARAVACIARSKKGVDFGALDGQPVHLFLAVLAPRGGSGVHLKALARGSRLLKDSSFCARLMTLPDAISMWNAIHEREMSDTPRE